MFGHMSVTIQLADALNVSDRTLRRAVSRGLLRGFRTDHALLAEHAHIVPALERAATAK
jgi:hypothetical protein